MVGAFPLPTLSPYPGPSRTWLCLQDPGLDLGMGGQEEALLFLVPALLHCD